MQGELGAGLRACSQEDELFSVHAYLPWITSWVGGDVSRAHRACGRQVEIAAAPGLPLQRPLPPSMVRGPGEALLMIRLVPEPHPLTLLHS